MRVNHVEMEVSASSWSEAWVTRVIYIYDYLYRWHSVREASAHLHYLYRWHSVREASAHLHYLYRWCSVREASAHLHYLSTTGCNPSLV